MKESQRGSMTRKDILQLMQDAAELALNGEGLTLGPGDERALEALLERAEARRDAVCALTQQFQAEEIETLLHTCAELYANSGDDTGDYLSERQQELAERVMHAWTEIVQAPDFPEETP